MNSSTDDYNQSPVASQTFYPHEQSVEHQQHLPRYRCSHSNRIHEKPEAISNFQPNSVVDYPHILLPNQHIRDLTDVYRREKDFLEQRHKHVSSNIEENSIKEDEESELKYSVTEYCSNIPCNCETSLPGRIFQNFVNGIKMSVEFFLFIGYVIGRRGEFFECYYPFEREQTNNSQIHQTYPFIRRSAYTTEMRKLNNLRTQLNRKPSPMKYTTTNTHYDIH